MTVGEPPSDEELMDRVQQGDAQAFEALFQRHRGAIYGYALRMVRHPEAAEDVFQDTFLQVHRARATWSSRDGTFRSWVYRIATNRIRDGARRSARRPEVLGEEPVSPVVSDHVDDRIYLDRLLGQLPEHLREAFLLGAVQGFDHNELAEVLEITPDNARARVSRARSRLRELMGEA